MTTYLDYWDSMPGPEVTKIRQHRYYSLEFLKKCIQTKAVTQGVVFIEGKYDNDLKYFEENRGSKIFQEKINPGVVGGTMTYLEYWNRFPPKGVSYFKKFRPSLELIRSFLTKKANLIVNLIEGPDDNDLDNFLARFKTGKRKRRACTTALSQNTPSEKRQRCEEINLCTNVENAQGVVSNNTQTDEGMQTVDAVPVPMIQPEQPMAQAPMQEADAPPASGSNGARRVVPTSVVQNNTLVLNGFTIEVDPVTLMVNATQMCKAAGKRWNDYHENSKSTAYTYALESKTGIPVLDLIKTNRGGNHSGTMVHRLIAYDLASWLSNDVKIQFYMWNDELRIENAELSTQIEELRANAALVPIAIAPARLPNANGAHKPLVLNGLVIEVDPDTFMVNATMMCKAAGKRWVDYRRNDTTDSYLKAMESKVRNPTFDLIRSKPGHNGGTMVHLLIALDLASWLSPEVKAQFNMWNAELLLTGRVELGKEMNVQKLAPSTPSCCTNPNGARNPLVLNGVTIEVDPVTLMVNATQMCKAAGKFFAEYHRSKCYKDFEKELSEAMGIPIGELTSCENGNRKGSMVHRRIAIHLAHRISPAFEVQVTGYLDELFMTGRVELGNEMNVQQLEEVWKRLVDEVKAKASADLSAEQDRCQEIILQKNELELRLATIQDAHQCCTNTDEEKKALVAIKTREDLEAAIQFQARATAPTIASYKEGDNVLYLARIDGTKFKYGCSKNVGRRFETHRRPGVYPTFEPIGVLPCANAVASEDQVRAYVKKTNIGVEYGTQREVVVLESVDALQRMMKKMQKCCRQTSSEGSEVVLRRIEAKTSIKMKKIDAQVDMEKIKADENIKKMDVDLEKKRMDVEMKKLQMVVDRLINFDQFLLIK